MASGLRVEDRLDAQVNFGTWKERIISVFEKYEVWGRENSNHTHICNTTRRVQEKECQGQEVDSGWHQRPRHSSVRGKDNAFEMWAALTSLY